MATSVEDREMPAGFRYTGLCDESMQIAGVSWGRRAARATGSELALKRERRVGLGPTRRITDEPRLRNRYASLRLT